MVELELLRRGKDVFDGIGGKGSREGWCRGRVAGDTALIRTILSRFRRRRLRDARGVVRAPSHVGHIR